MIKLDAAADETGGRSSIINCPMHQLLLDVRVSAGMQVAANVLLIEIDVTGYQD